MIIDAPHPTHFPALRRLWTEAFGDTEEFLNVFWRAAFSENRCRCLIQNGEVAAALYWFDCEYNHHPIAYLYAVATAKSHRGQGLCRTLMEDTHRHLKVLGYEGAILVPGNGRLFELYEKLGYQPCSRIREFSCVAADAEEEDKPQKLSLTEYAELRRAMLPDGGVIQEKENLKLLQTQANLYGGEDFVAAVRPCADSLHGIELLGNPAAAPKLLRALGYEKGTFRTVGTDRPFAMFRPLTVPPIAPPTHFGLAFD